MEKVLAGLEDLRSILEEKNKHEIRAWEVEKLDSLLEKEAEAPRSS